MTQQQSFAVLIAHMLLSLGVLTAATVLCALNKLDATATVALFGAAIGVLGANAQSLSTAVVNGGPKPNLDKIAANNPEQLASVIGASAGHTPSEAAAPAPTHPTNAVNT